MESVKKEGESSSPDFAAFMEAQAKQNETMMNVIAQQGQILNGLTGTLNSLNESVKGGLSVKPGEAKPEPFDFENADNVGLTRFILGEVGGMMKGLKEDITGQLGDLKSTSARKEKLEEIDKVRAMKGNEDLDQWLPEMRDLATSNPTLSISRLLSLARVENPEKDNELKSKRQEKLNEGIKSEDVFGGLTPTSLPESFGERTSKDKRAKTVEEAVNKAWDSVVPASMKRESAENHDPLF